MSRKAIFLDRDGTIIVDKHYLHDPDKVELLEGAADAMSLARENGYQLFLFTNQSGIGRGMYTMKDAENCNARMVEMMGKDTDFFTETCIAPEHPDQESKYRKPSPAFILEMVEKYSLNPQECWMVGDRDADLLAGINAGVNAAYVRTGKPYSDAVDGLIKEEKAIDFEDLPSFVNSLLS